MKLKSGHRILKTNYFYQFSRKKITSGKIPFMTKIMKIIPGTSNTDKQFLANVYNKKYEIKVKSSNIEKQLFLIIS